MADAMIAGGPGTPVPTAVAGSMTPTAWWDGLSTELSSRAVEFSTKFQRFHADLKAAQQQWKPPEIKGLGVKVDLDMLNPTLGAARQHWQQLPEPVRQALPLAGVALLAGSCVQRFYCEQLRLAEQRYGALSADFNSLQARNRDMEGRLADLTARSSTAGTRPDLELADTLAKVVQAGAAAAAAAAAAASAAAACAQLPRRTARQLARPADDGGEVSSEAADNAAGEAWGQTSAAAAAAMASSPPLPARATGARRAVATRPRVAPSSALVVGGPPASAAAAVVPQQPAAAAWLQQTTQAAAERLDAEPSSSARPARGFLALPPLPRLPSGKHDTAEAPP